MYSSSQKKKKKKKRKRKTPYILNFGIGNFVCVYIYIHIYILYETPPKDRVLYIFIKQQSNWLFYTRQKCEKKSRKKKKFTTNQLSLSPQAL